LRPCGLSVAAAFGLPHQDLDDGQQRLFRRLGLHPGPDIGAYAAAALDGNGVAAARQHLEALYPLPPAASSQHALSLFRDVRQHSSNAAYALNELPCASRKPSANQGSDRPSTPHPRPGTCPPPALGGPVPGLLRVSVRRVVKAGG
jgi:hypothetical protein